MLFQYIGDDNEPPKVTTVFGFRFALNGDPIEITDTRIVEKLKGIKTFRVIEPPKVEEPAEAVVKTVNKKDK